MARLGHLKRLISLGLLGVLILSLLAVPSAVAGDSAGAHIEIVSESNIGSPYTVHAYLSDTLFRDAAGKLHLGLCRIGPHDGYYFSSTDGGATWPTVLNITREATASKGGTVYINQQTGKGIYLGFFNVSGYDQNFTSNYGATWTTGAYNFIPGSSNGLYYYLYPLGSVYDGNNTVYAMTWGSKYHYNGNGKIGVSKTTNLGTTWTSLSGVANTNTLILDSSDSYAVDSADMVLDSSGNLFVLYMAMDTSGKWNLKAYNAATGARELVYANLGYTRFSTTAITAWLDLDGKVNAAVTVETGPNEQSTIYHVYRTGAGTWVVNSTIGSDGISRRPYNATSAMDSSGNVYLVWSNYEVSSARYRMFSSVRPASTGSWGPVTELVSTAPGVGASNPALRQLQYGPDRDSVEMVWSQTSGSVREVHYGRLSIVGGQAVDNTPPVITPTVIGFQGNDGWYTSNVTVSWAVTDEESEVTAIIGGETTVISEDTAGVILACEATSSGGTAYVSVTIKRDGTAPVISAGKSPETNAAGWNNSDVTVQFAASDALSGIASVSPDAVMTAEGMNQSVTGTAEDAAGNQANIIVTGVNIDKAAPAVTYTGNVGTYSVGEEVNITCSASDNLSGVASDTCQDIIGTAYSFPDVNTYSAEAIDLAGNIGSASVSFTVQVDYEGLRKLVKKFVTKQGIINSLLAKLNAAEAADARGNAYAADNIMAAFINELTAQTGKAISAEQAAILIRLAQAL